MSRIAVSDGPGVPETRAPASPEFSRSRDPGDSGRRVLTRALAVVVGGYMVLVLLMLGIGLSLTHPLNGSIGHWDEAVNVWLARHRTHQLNDVTAVSTWFVNTLPAVVIAFVITGVLLAVRRIGEAMMLLVALALELGVFLSVTWTVDRPRPNVVRLDHSPSTASFPSGHTAAATVLFFGLAIIITRWNGDEVVRALCVGLAALAVAAVGFARVYRGLHHPTDTLAGAALGAGCLVVAVLVVRTGRPRPTVTTSGVRESTAIPSRAA